MSDIITRLLLKTDDFDAKLTRSKAGVNSYQNDVSSMAKTAGAGVLKFAAAIGVSVGASEAFMKVIRSSQATNDEWDNSLNACKSTVEVFFQSLSTGNFNAFNNGLLVTMKNMKELSALRDSLGDAKLSMGYNVKTFDAQFTQYESIIRDTNKSVEARRNAFNELSALKSNFKTDIDDTLNGSTQTLLKELNSKSGRNDFTIDDIQKYISINNNDFSSRSEKKALTKYQSELRKLQEKQYTTQYIGGGVLAGSTQSVEDKSITRKIQLLKESNKELEKQNWLNNDNDGSRLEMIKDLEYIQDLKKRGYDFDKRTLELQASLKSAKVEEKNTPGSIASLDAEIAKKSKELINATTAQARTAVQVVIDELEAKKISLKIELDKSVFKELHGEMKGGDIKTNGIPTSGHGISKETIKDMKLPKFKSPISKKDVKLNEEYNDSLAAMGGLMGSLSGVFESNTGSVLQWGATLLSTIAQAIPAIIGMMGVKATDTTVTQANTAAEVGNAAAKTMSAHASIPFAGIAIGLAGVASIIAVMSSMPKFATGGIVGGSSFSGDNVLARVNSGEMILNADQQSNLFRLLNGQVSSQRPVLGNISNIRMQPGKQIVEVGGQVRIQGGDLILAINNKNSKMKGKR